jgi:1-acyl-sn-glycerol-3-phosphate acyltransferase
MKRAWIRSSLFNIAFIIVTGVLCVVYIPLLLLPRKWFTGAVRFWIYSITVLEVGILNLTYEVQGKEHLPKDGPFLVAAKHQSPYETFKIRILINDPAIVLKKELLRIPLWGSYLKKSDVIAIDRSTPERALKSLEEGALRIKEQGRPIVIFPQGTRVRPEETPAQKPYKAGIARVQEATNLPIIPLALNSGMFWPRSGWLKSAGKVTFRFLEPIAPGKERRELMRELEEKIEGESSALMNEIRAKELERSGGKGWIALTVLFALLFGAYSYAWFYTAERIQERYLEIIRDIAGTGTLNVPQVSGYPGPIHLKVAEQVLQSNEGSVKIQNFHAWGFPLPLLPVKVSAAPVSITSYKWSEPLVLESVDARLSYFNDVVTVQNSIIKKGDFTGGITGTADLKQEPVPILNMTISLQKHQSLLTDLAALNILEQRTALFMSAGFAALADADGIVRLPLTQNGQTLYAGPLPVASLPVLPRQEPGNQPAPDL